MGGHFDHTHPKPQKTSQMTLEQKQETKAKSIDVRDAKEAILSSLDEKTKEEMRKVKYEEYLRENRDPQDQSKHWRKNPLPLKIGDFRIVIICFYYNLCEG